MHPTGDLVMSYKICRNSVMSIDDCRGGEFYRERERERAIYLFIRLHTCFSYVVQISLGFISVKYMMHDTMPYALKHLVPLS